MNVVAIVVARRDSVRIPGKALVRIGGEPLVSRKVKQLAESKRVSQVIVGTNWSDVADICAPLDAKVIYRDDYYCDESVCSANEMISDMIRRLECDDNDIIVWAHPTNPLLSSLTYDTAIATFLAKEKEGFDSLLSVKRFKEHLWDNNFKPLNYDPYTEVHTPARDLPEYYMQDGGIFIQRYASFRINSYFFGNKPYLFVIPDEEFFDVNREEDVACANSMVDLLNRRKQYVE